MHQKIFCSLFILLLLIAVVDLVAAPTDAWGFSGSTYFGRGQKQQQDHDHNHDTEEDASSSSSSSSPSAAARASIYKRTTRAEQAMMQEEEEETEARSRFFSSSSTDQESDDTHDENGSSKANTAEDILRHDDTREEVRRAREGSGIGSVISSMYDADNNRKKSAPQNGGGESASSSSSSSPSPAARLLNDWERKGTHAPCWKAAVARLKSQCKNVLAEKDERTRLALAFMACQLELDGKDPTPVRCPRRRNGGGHGHEEEEEDVAACSARVPESLYSVYISFSHHVDTLCFHIQEELLHHRTKMIVDRLGVASSQAAQSLAELAVSSAGIDQQMQTMHVSQKQATASAETLAGALRQVSDLGGDIRQLISDDRVNVEAIAEKITTLLETHASMEKSNQALANSLRVLADDHVRAVGRLGQEVDDTRKKLLAGIDGLHGIQAKTSRFIGSLDAFLHYGTFFIVVWIVTTASRTQDARFFALLGGPVTSMLCERYVLVGALKMFSMFGLASNPDNILNWHQQHNNNHNDHDDQLRDAFVGTSAASLLDPTPLRNFFILVAVAIVIFFAVFFESPEQRQRRILQLEISTALAEALGKTSGSSKPRITQVDDDENGAGGDAKGARKSKK